MASLLKAQGKLDDVEPPHQEDPRASRATLGDRHPHTLVSINNMASLLQAQGKLDDAEPLYREAIAASRSTLGIATEHARLDQQHGVAGLDQGRLDDAEPLYGEARSIARRRGSPPEHACLDQQRGVAAQGSGQARRCAKLPFRESMKGCEATLAPGHQLLRMRLARRRALPAGRPCAREVLTADVVAAAYVARISGRHDTDARGGPGTNHTEVQGPSRCAPPQDMRSVLGALSPETRRWERVLGVALRAERAP